MIKDVQEKKISFYTAECMEFETMGEVTECATLKEAFRIIPENGTEKIRYGGWDWIYFT